jgi:hypothetical protein
MNFVQGEAHFVHNNWSVTIYRSRLGNRMDGFRYHYSFQAIQCEPQADGYVITNKVRGNGGKRDALNAIKHETQEA